MLLNRQIYAVAYISIPAEGVAHINLTHDLIFSVPLI